MSTKPPRSLPSREGKGNRTQFDPEDLSWWGPTGDEDYSHLIAERGYEPEEPLRLVVRAIIAASPAGPGTGRQREEQALAALTGVARVGRRRAERYGLLLEVAREYRRAFWDGRPTGTTSAEKAWEPALETIVRAVVPDDHPLVALESIEVGSLRKGLVRKFKADRDILLKRLEGEQDPDRVRERTAVMRVLRAMEAAGIPVDPNVLPNWLKGSDENSTIESGERSPA